MTQDPTASSVERAVDAALDAVVDPCSNALGEPLGLLEMGLVADRSIVAGHVEVAMRLTSPCCAYGPTMAEAARREIERVDGVTSVAVRIDHAAVWTPEQITPVAADRVRARRAATVELTGVRPHDWSSWRAERSRDDR